jgi:hypothetical protein
MYCVKMLVSGSQSAEQVLGPYTREAAQEMVMQLARQQTGGQVFYAYLTRL